jgi:signal transduction histidine kinase/CheY-like chemotaxis protein
MNPVLAFEDTLERERLARVEAERVADETIRDLYERQCEIQMLRSVAFAANDARSIEGAMRSALASVCRYARWAVGHVFFVTEDDRLVSADLWHDEAHRFTDLRQHTEATTLVRGAGLCGQVLAQALPVWIENVADLDDESGVRDLNRFGVRAAVGVPVLVGERVRAVLELFDEQARPFDGHFVDVMGQVGTMLGRVIEREQAQRELHQANERLTRALVDLQQAQDHIVQQERLRALGQMASGIAHDFNNALHPIVGYAELLQTQPEIASVPNARRYLRHMLTAANDAASVVGRLREFYRRRDDEDVLVPIDLVTVVEEVADLTRPRWYNEALASGIRICVVTDLEPVPRIMGHDAQLREACMNLVLNAVDAMPSGGTIVLRTRSDGGRVLVDVCDSGVGMSDDVRRQCLEPFFTTKGQRGSGLGLGMVYGIVHRHDGTLNIASTPGHGTTVTLGFPAAPAGITSGAAIAPRSAPAPMRVLVVDDKPAAREMLQELLEADGHHPETVEKGIDAVARLRETPFDLVITDRSMPAMSGDELARIIKESARPVPVIMITGFGVLMKSADERPFGVDIVLPKPVARSALRDALAAVAIPQLDLSTVHRPMPSRRESARPAERKADSARARHSLAIARDWSRP